MRRNSIDAGLKPVHTFDLMFYDPENITDTVDLDLDAYYRQAGIVTMRSSWDNGSIFVGLHGGSNSVSHGDLDIGNFVLYASGKRFFTDLGFDNYNIPNYFGDLRWTYYRKRAEGQNTLVMGDVSYKTPDQVTTAVARFDRVEFNESNGIAILDTTPAYEGLVPIVSSRRGLFFTDNRSTVVIQDEVHFSQATTVRWAAHTPGTITISEDSRSAFIQNGDVCLYCEIVSDDPMLHFTGDIAESYDPDYIVPSGSYTDNGSKLMIISDTEITDFSCAVVMKVINTDMTPPSTGTVYQWTDMEDWVLQ